MERKSVVTYQAERQSFLCNQIFVQTRCSDWLNCFTGKGKNETGSGEFGIRSKLPPAHSSARQTNGISASKFSFACFSRTSLEGRNWRKECAQTRDINFAKSIYFSAYSPRNKIEIRYSYVHAKIKNSIIPRNLRNF